LSCDTVLLGVQYIVQLGRQMQN